MSEIHVRAVKMADERAILALVHEEMEAHARMDARFRLRADAGARYVVYLRERLRDIDSSVFVAEVEARVVGLAIGTVRKQNVFFEERRYGYISDLMVERAARRRGIGRALYDRTVLWFRGLGIGVVRLHIAVKSDEARAFWKSVGAGEFLVESWIDLGDVGVAAPPDGALAGTAVAAAPPDASPPPLRSGFDYPDDVLTGRGGSL